MRVRTTIASALPLLAFGCAGDPGLRAETTELRRRLDDAQRRAATAEDKLQQLEDRVFLLTDQVESQRVAAARSPAPRLPVVTLHPSEPEETAGDAVAFEGEAQSRNPEHVRPLLHLDGSRSEPRTPTRTQTETKAETQSSTENLGVAAAPRIPSSPSMERAPVAADPLRLYRTAYDALRAGRHADAERDFQAFVRLYPGHDYADNAQYWLGECYYDLKQYAPAAAEFQKVVARYPLGNKAPDALLKLGFCLLALGDAKKGRETLSQVPSSYPRTEAARLAEERLRELSRLEGTQ
jgi:tol-pal system protein YbgF